MAEVVTNRKVSLNVTFREVLAQDGPMLAFPFSCMIVAAYVFYVATDKWITLSAFAFLGVAICTLCGHWCDVYFDIRFQRILSQRARDLELETRQERAARLSDPYQYRDGNVDV